MFTEDIGVVFVAGAILCLAALVWMFLWTRSIGAERVKDIEWMKQHKWKIFLCLTAPDWLLLAPILETCIFQLPLLLLFSEITVYSGIAILISVHLFGLMHYYKPILPPFIGIVIGIASYSRTLKNKNLYEKGKWLRYCSSCPIALVEGYLAVRYHSLLLPIAVHASWNGLLFCISFILRIYRAYTSNAHVSKNSVV